MGPFLVVGAACFGGAVAIGLITSAAVQAASSSTQPLAVRALYVLSVAFREGTGVLGVIIGFLAITLADVGDGSTAIVVAVLAVGGAVAGLILASRGGPDVARLRSLGVPFIGGLGTLGLVVAVLGVIMGSGATMKTGDGPFAIVALILFVVQLLAGILAARDIAELGGSPSGGDAAVTTPGTLEYVRARAIRVAALMQLIVVAAVTIAILLLVTSTPRAT